MHLHPVRVGVVCGDMLAHYQVWHPVLPVLAGGCGPVVVSLVGDQEALVVLHPPAQELLLPLAGYPLQF